MIVLLELHGSASPPDLRPRLSVQQPRLSANHALTVTCYDPSLAGEACGSCDACLLRRKGFEENGLVDPASYISETAVVV